VETEDAQEQVLHHGQNTSSDWEMIQVYPLVEFKLCKHATTNINREFPYLGQHVMTVSRPEDSWLMDEHAVA
jgi:hypothetical protein